MRGVAVDVVLCKMLTGAKPAIYQNILSWGIRFYGENGESSTDLESQLQYKPDATIKKEI